MYLLATLLLLAAVGAGPAFGMAIETKLIAADSAAGDQFSSSVSVSGDIAVVGAFADDDDGSASGSAYVFGRDEGGPDNWGLLKKLTASDAAAGDNFGTSVSISGDTIVVGALGDDDNGSASGSAYVFDRDEGGVSNWGEVKKLTAGDGAATDTFGRSVSVSGDTVVVGANQDDDAGADSGSAYVFGRDQGGLDNWGQVKKLTADDAASGDKFGVSVSIDMDTVVVGANGDAGRAYVFGRDQGGVGNWGQVKKLVASDAAGGDQFGLSVAVDGDTALIGSPFDDDAGPISGSAYFFERDQGGTDNWGELTKVTAVDAAAFDGFGTSVGLSGNAAVIGAFRDDDGFDRAGSSYVYRPSVSGTTWNHQTKLHASDAGLNDEFGTTAALSGATVVVGALQIAVGAAPGKAYAYELIAASVPVSSPSVIGLLGGLLALTGAALALRTLRPGSSET